MKRLRSLAIPLLLLTPSFAMAAVRTFVATTGVDNATCLRANPCRTFQAAINVVDPGGEVVVLDSGGYGPVDISKSVSIIAPAGIHAAIAPTTGNGIAVLAALTDNVTIRNLSITLLGGFDGIQGLHFKRLYIEDCLISNALNRGIIIAPSNTDQQVFITDTEVRNSGHSGIAALVSGLTNRVYVNISRTRSNGNGRSGIGTAGSGFDAAFGSQVVCTDCEAYGNATNGFTAQATDFTGAELWCERCVAGNNIQDGFNAFALTSGIANITVSRSAAFNNLIGLHGFDNTGGVATIFVLPGTNALSGNNTEKLFSSGSLSATTPDFP